MLIRTSLLHTAFQGWRMHTSLSTDAFTATVRIHRRILHCKEKQLSQWEASIHLGEHNSYEWMNLVYYDVKMGSLQDTVRRYSVKAYCCTLQLLCNVNSFILDCVLLKLSVSCIHLLRAVFHIAWWGVLVHLLYAVEIVAFEKPNNSKLPSRLQWLCLPRRLFDHLLSHSHTWAWRCCYLCSL